MKMMIRVSDSSFEPSSWLGRSISCFRPAARRVPGRSHCMYSIDLKWHNARPFAADSRSPQGERQSAFSLARKKIRLVDQDANSEFCVDCMGQLL